MNKLFIDDIVDRMGNELTILECDQKSVKELIIDMGMEDKFPMICFEHTEDSDFDVSIDESKFLNDSSHNGSWLLGKNDDEIIFLINFKSYGKRLEIDALETNIDYRGEGFGANVVGVVESVAEHYYDEVSVSPFDTDAMNFWNHMDYLEMKDGLFIKSFD